MKIGIIGSGHIGGTLTEKLAAAGHLVGVANAHGPQSLEARAASLGKGVCAMTVDEAARYGELVIVSIPFGRYRSVPVAPLDGKIVVDTENYYPQRDGHFDELDDDRMTSSELVQEHLPQARVVKAFNAVRWDTLAEEGRPRGAAGRLAVSLAGDDVEAKRIVAELIDEIGFDPVDVGDLAQGGRKIQPGTPVYTARVTAAELTRRLAA
jgi:8-hydroxy-5-deazaflavin:NADPH oxidoreductase